MKTTKRFLVVMLLALVSPALLGPASAKANSNTTVQVGQVNINRTVQCGESNDNATYQEGRVNINQTVQGCRTEDRTRGRAGEMNPNRSDRTHGQAAAAAKVGQRR